jgi:hypothetical protein
MLPCLSTQSPPGYALFELFRLSGLIALTTGEVFEGKEDCHQRLQSWGLFEGFGVVQGRVGRMGLLGGSSSVSRMVPRL